MKISILIIILLAILFIFPSSIHAHAFGILYTLPIPLWLYLWGAGAALIVSFLIIGFFAKQSSHFSLPKFHFKLKPSITIFLKFLGLSLFILTILTGLFGSQSPTQNFAINFFWIVFLLGFTYLSAIFGNIWEIVNPWKITMGLFSDLKPLLPYPKKLGYTPALIFYYLLIWVELLSGGLGIQPATFSKILLLYTNITFFAYFIFGADWFKYGEFFSVFFGLISKLSPFTKTSLIEDRCKHFSLLIFILFMLSSTAFDGFRSTSTWIRFFYNNLISFPYEIIQTILLLLSPLFFLILYLISIILMKFLTRTKNSIKDLSLQFTYSLIPIALAYNIAHYYTLLLTQGQSIIPLISDPFNLGWNLFGTVGYSINIGILGAGFVWHSEVAVIIIGHILAVFLAHLIALRIFPRKQAIISQIPMLALMVLYTITGLWILSQPLTVEG